MAKCPVLDMSLCNRHAGELKTCVLAGPVDCLKIIWVSLKAREVVKSIANEDRANAVRHFVWQAMLTYLLGEDVATSVGNAHEKGQDIDPNPRIRRDSMIDRHNNEVTRRWMSSSQIDLGGLSDPSAYLLDIGLNLVSQGKLKT
jgi:uncharacterized protein DUF6973